MTEQLLLNPDVDDQRLLSHVLDYYHNALKNSSVALDYLKKRGITHGEAIQHFRIGYADRSLGLKLPAKQVQAGRQIRARLEQMGLLRASGHEQFNGCVVFPVSAADGSGKVVDIYGRKIGQRLRKGTPLDMLLGQRPCGVWNWQAFSATSEIILVPSVFDALAFWQAGFRNVTCTFGPDTLSDDHLVAFKTFEIRRVLTPCDQLIERLHDAGLDCAHLALPAGVNANAYARQCDDPRASLGEIIRAAEAIGTGRSATIPPPANNVEAEINHEEVVIHLGDRRYRIRGLSKNLSVDALRVNVLASNERAMFVDTFDLYTARNRQLFVNQAATELGVEQRTINKDLGRVLLKLEELQDQYIREATEPSPSEPTMSEAEKEAALELLRAPNLLERILADFDVVGEETNKLIGYLAAVSRKLDEPIAILVQSSSAAGKTSLMDAILSFVPPEDQIKYSAMTGQSLFYMGEHDLKHKVLAIVEEEGAERAAYALKLLQSEGELTIASTGKDVATSRLVTQVYRVEGPVMIMLATTALKIDEELLNRCIVLTVDEDRDQTRAIHRRQRERQTLPGQLAKRERQQTLTLHRNAQRLLRPLLVANPYAESLTFLDHKTRTRRDHTKYLTLIRTVALLHQYQRPIKTVAHGGEQFEYIEATLDDIEVANRLASEVLGRAVDELPPQTRTLLGLIQRMVAEGCDRAGIDQPDFRFTRRDIREQTGWGHTQLKIHLRRLVELEYLLVHRGGRGRQFVYELVYQGSDDRLHTFTGLIDVDQLRREWSGSNDQRSETGRPLVGQRSVGGRSPEINSNGKEVKALRRQDAELGSESTSERETS